MMLEGYQALANEYLRGVANDDDIRNLGKVESS